jgi:hypothetical protein
VVLYYVVSMYRSIFLTLILASIPFSLVYSQEATQSIELTLAPQQPNPRESFTARIDSFTMDLDEALITWRYNNSVVASGVGTRSVSLVAPAAGGAATIYVTARGVEGNATTLFTVRPAAIDLVWESPNTYTPPFYKGKALPAPGAAVRILAIPAVGAPQTLSYEWSYNDSVVQNQSGRGKARFTLNTDILTTVNNIRLRASGAGFSAEESIGVPLRTPTLVAYKKNNSFIDFSNGTINTITLAEAGTTLRFEPFNFTSVRGIINDLRIALTLGGSPVAGGSRPNELPLSRPEEQGSDTVTVSAESVEHQAQSASQTFRIDF